MKRKAGNNEKGKEEEKRQRAREQQGKQRSRHVPESFAAVFTDVAC